MQPVSETLFASNAWIKGIGIATNYDRVKNIPDGGTVYWPAAVNMVGLILLMATAAVDPPSVRLKLTLNIAALGLILPSAIVILYR